MRGPSMYVVIIFTISLAKVIYPIAGPRSRYALFLNCVDLALTYLPIVVSAIRVYALSGSSRIVKYTLPVLFTVSGTTEY